MTSEMMTRCAATVGAGCLWIVLSSCAGAPPPDTEVGDTATAGETVATTLSRDGQYETTVVEHGAVVFRVVMRRSEASYHFDAELLADGASLRRESFDATVETSVEGPTADGLNRVALFKLGRMRDAIAVERGLPIQQDRAGCDGIGGSCGPTGSCCDMHDKCLADCWESATGGACAAGCDAAVVACFAGTAVPCAIGQIFGGGEGCKSECCDVGGRNICEADCSDATPGGWYKWGNHSCTADVLINFYCTADPGSCSNYHCYKYDGHTGVSTELTDGSFACDACAEGYCNEAFNCVTCPNPIVDPQGHELGVRDPYCNPPVYSPGSFMDSICMNGEKPLPPAHATRLICDAVHDGDGCHNVCSFESGLGGGAQNFCGPMPGTDACIPGLPGHAIPRGCDGNGHCVVETWCDFNDAKNWQARDFRWTACMIGPPDNIRPYCDGTPLPSHPPDPPSGPVCGDASCDGGENCGSCPQDCGSCSTCGNGACDNGEDCGSCPQDCGSCTYCGNGACDGGEGCGSCPQDCGACDSCGNGVCDGYPEDCGTCPGDCPCPGGTTCQDRQCVPEPYCGDGACNNGEDCGSCGQDCGSCAYCGDGACNNGEDCGSCGQDCGSCEYCGDGSCNNGEDCGSCSQDCGSCEYCGDGSCNAGEDCGWCPWDCGDCVP